MRKINVYIILRCRILRCLLPGLFIISCESFLEVDIPKNKIASELVFSDDVTATSAVTGIYQDMLGAQSFSSGNYLSTVALSGLAADELSNYNEIDGLVDFEENVLTPSNNNISLLWTSMYKTIYQANAVLEGLSNSQSLTLKTKTQLEGEALFIRAFCHFYLVNLFGDVPIIIATDYNVNSIVSREPVQKVYEQILNDLLIAQESLSDNYWTKDVDFVTPARVRPNKATATALLARVYLYMGDWGNAEAQSTSIISNTSMYALSDLNEVFLRNSSEAIWQLRPLVPGYNTLEATSFIVSSIVQYNILSDHLLNAFELNDKRQSGWIGSFDTGNGVVYFPYKYKKAEFDPELDPPTEYSMVFRLAEQYLIRAEARAQLNNLPEAIVDLDAIRSRAELPKLQDTTPGISQDELILAIEHERQIEFFAEWGHRWLDLKRTGRADEVLDPIKAEWNPEDALFPLPDSEFKRNPKLGRQNDGY